MQWRLGSTLSRLPTSAEQPVNYSEFRRLLLDALRDEDFDVLPIVDSLDTDSLDRTCSVPVAARQQLTPPFHAGAEVSFRWRAVHSARFATTEEDFLSEIVDRDRAERMNTERPWVRVDMNLRASTPWGKPIRMASPEKLSRWRHELRVRLDEIERLLPEDEVEETASGELAYLAYKGEPQITVTSDADGNLLLSRIVLESFVAVHPPRVWDDPERPEDDEVHVEVEQMAKRLRAALYAWGEALDHLV